MPCVRLARALTCLHGLIASGGAVALPSAPIDERELACMAEAVAYEAGGEPEAGQEAVAQVILNRLRDPRYPKSVCAIVYQGSARRTGCQFSFTCDGSLARTPLPHIRDAARAVAERALAGELARTIGSATHYHADYVAPYWTSDLVRIAAIGRHIFYRRPGAGEPLSASAPSAPRPEAPTFSPWGVPVAALKAR